MSVNTQICRAINGMSNVCGDLLQASGADKDFYVGYVADLSVKFSAALTGPISNIQFYPYTGLVKFQGRKYANKFDHDGQVAPGGNISVLHKGLVKLNPLNTQDDVEILRLIQAQDMFIVNSDNNDQFFIYAPFKGFSYVPGPIKTTGQAENEDTLSTLNFTSAEKVLPLRFDRGTTVQANIDYLDSLSR